MKLSHYRGVKINDVFLDKNWSFDPVCNMHHSLKGLAFEESFYENVCGNQAYKVHEAKSVKTTSGELSGCPTLRGTGPLYFNQSQPEMTALVRHQKK